MSSAQEYEEKWALQAQMFGNRLRKRQRHLKKWAKRKGVTCYRVYHLDIPEVSFSIDWYDDFLYVSEWRRHHSHPEELHPLWLEWMYETICETLSVDRENLFIKHREKKKGTQQYEKFGEEKRRMIVEEGGHKFWVNLTDYLDTGLFLDHRVTRGMAQDDAKGRKCLNLFAYTGAFSVYLAAGGATHTTTVDMSKTYVKWASDNLELNGFSGRNHRVIHDDVFSFLRAPARDNETYDLIILDPPTFSNSKRMTGDFDIQRDHYFLVRRCLSLLRPGGVLYFSTNFRRFELEATAVEGTAECKEITYLTVPEDFRHAKIHRCWRMTVAG